MRGKESVKKRKGGFSIQSIIMFVLMASTLITVTVMGLLLYNRFKLAMDNTAVSNTEATVESSVDRLNSRYFPQAQSPVLAIPSVLHLHKCLNCAYRLSSKMSYVQSLHNYP